mmetsp:Transcript_16293/g.45500  ORF Transcript_16293/g.45500 Transcript_16293/m.45500 type:complete len:101 (+) Transcript_16293:154-456(+)
MDGISFRGLATDKPAHGLLTASNAAASVTTPSAASTSRWPVAPSIQSRKKSDSPALMRSFMRVATKQIDANRLVQLRGIRRPLQLVVDAIPTLAHLAPKK